MGKLFWTFMLVFCLVAVQGKKKTAEKAEKFETHEPQDQDETENEDASTQLEAEQAEENEQTNEQADVEGSGEEVDDSDSKEFQCNLKFKRVGCYADKSKAKRPLKSFIMSDSEMGAQVKRGKLPEGNTFNNELPKFACKCANEALNSGNAVFGLQNLAECWSGPDSSKYDKDGESENCVTFDFAPCDSSSEICAGKKHANFVYYVDTPEHTKSEEQIQQELKEEAAKKKKKTAQQKKKINKKKAKKALKKKSKKGKKEQ